MSTSSSETELVQTWGVGHSGPCPTLVQSPHQSSCRARSKEVGNPLIFFISLQVIRSGILRVTGTVPGPAGAGVQGRPLRPRGRAVSAWAACCCCCSRGGRRRVFFCYCSGVLVLQHLEQEFRVPEDCCTLLTQLGSSGALKRGDRCSIRHCLRKSGVR
jgi:hypothetical protein